MAAHPPTRRVRLAAALAVVGLAAACTSERGGDDDAEARPIATPIVGSAPEEVAVGADFYAVPEPLPDADHGTLLKYQVVPGVVERATTYRVMYLSTAVAGEPVVVTGLAVVPASPAPGGGEGRVVLTTAHGTTGVADECAPSKSPATSEAKRLGQVAVDNGWVLAATDYEGLGTPGRHPYLVGRSEGRSVLDAVLATQQLPEAGEEVGDRVLIAGYSQGGHAAVWANEIAAEWVPELEVVGAFAGAPASEIDRILEAGRSLPIGGFLLAIVAGYEAAYAELDPAAYLTDKGVGLLDAVDSGCISESFRATAGVSPAELVGSDPAEQAEWIRIGADNNAGSVAAPSPVLIVHSDEDSTVPPVLSQLLHARMCASGQVVERRVLAKGGDHGAAAVPAYTQGIAWLKGLLAGTPAVSSCGP